jgi:hypothetical protein
MKPRILGNLLALALLLPGLPGGLPCLAGDAGPLRSISLAGTWRVRLDPDTVGIVQNWQCAEYADTLRLPGSLATNGYGEEPSFSTQWTGSILDKSWYTSERFAKYRTAGNIKLPFWLKPDRHYVGAAWYQRDFVIPGEWKKKEIRLFLERCHWETRAWLDGRALGLENSLSAPHEYPLGSLAPGKHRLTIRIDNSQKIRVGSDAHSICDHTQTNWNGIIGRIELQAHDSVWIDDVQVYPRLTDMTAVVRIALHRPGVLPLAGAIVCSASPRWGEAGRTPGAVTRARRIARGDSSFEIALPMGEDALLWDEFSPRLYTVRVAFSGRQGGRPVSDERTIVFGMREFRSRGTNFTLNGRVTFLRGTLECCIFPLTGYPPTDLAEWLRVLGVARDHGLNHIRFHSWCPPEAAFEAADQLGMILHVESPVWTRLGDAGDIDAFISAESDRILRRYGNHPSFCMMAVGNEPSGEKANDFLTTIVASWKRKDPRRLYTTCSGWPILPVSDYNSTPEPRGHAWGAGLTSRFNALPLSTDTDYAPIISRYTVPTVSHEIGQWCVYPDLKEIAQYTGILKATNFEIVREDLEAKKMLDQAEDFLMASGRLQVLEYKEEIEAALRTKGFGGFQLLDLHDFPGQGTALVGMLNPFWRSKGYLEPAEFRSFCSPAVPLLRMKKVVWTNEEEFVGNAEFANYSAAEIPDATPVWTLAHADGSPFAEGTLDRRTIPQGSVAPLGAIRLSLGGIRKAEHLVLTLALKRTPYANRWSLWVYPASLPEAGNEGLVLARELDAVTEEALKDGKTVILLPDTARVRSNVPPGFSSIFWNTAWTSGQPPHTLGILCRPSHPLFSEFPTEFHSDWQWWDLVSKSRAIVLDSLPHSAGVLVQVIDDWNSNRRLALVVEARVGRGRLLICSIDVTHDLAHRPVARQFLYSLKKYAASDAFRPECEVPFDSLRHLLKGK